MDGQVGRSRRIGQHRQSVEGARAAGAGGTERGGVVDPQRLELGDGDVECLLAMLDPDPEKRARRTSGLRAVATRLLEDAHLSADGRQRQRRGKPANPPSGDVCGDWHGCAAQSFRMVPAAGLEPARPRAEGF